MVEQVGCLLVGLLYSYRAMLAVMTHTALLNVNNKSIFEMFIDRRGLLFRSHDYQKTTIKSTKSLFPNYYKHKVPAETHKVSR